MENVYINFLRVWRVPISRNILYSARFEHILVECIHLSMKTEKQALCMFLLLCIFNERIKQVAKRKTKRKRKRNETKNFVNAPHENITPLLFVV